ncbi:MAG: NADH-quinone oxidoreductase subunit NuoK [Planctomycetota bacterium]
MPLPLILLVSNTLFSLGFYTVLSRKNAISILMGIELILNSANLNFVSFYKYGLINVEGIIAVIINIMLAACEVVVALAIVLAIYKNFKTIDVDRVDTLKH